MRRRSRGFTLVELMVVVSIMGVLATVAIRAVRGHIAASQSKEALAMVQSIAAAQERYRSLEGVYLDVSGDGAWFPRDPSGASGVEKRAFYSTSHTDNARWAELNPTVTGPVRFGYTVNAGLAGQLMTPVAAAVTWPTPPRDPWYVIQAQGDLDGDGRASYFVASSLNGEVFRQAEAE